MDQTQNIQAKASEYDSRWFIWTIVFLIVAGVGLTTYIISSDTSVADNTPIVVHHSTGTVKQ